MGNIFSSCSGRSEIDGYDDRRPRRRESNRRRRRSRSRSRSRDDSYRGSSRRDRGSGHGSGHGSRGRRQGRDRERSRSGSRDRGHHRERSRELDTPWSSNRHRGSHRSNSSDDDLYNHLGGDVIVGSCGRSFRSSDGTRRAFEQDFITDGRNTYRFNTRVTSNRGPFGYGPRYFGGRDPNDSFFDDFLSSRAGGDGRGGGGGSRSHRRRDRDRYTESGSGSDRQVPVAGDGRNRLLGDYPRGRILGEIGSDR